MEERKVIVMTSADDLQVKIGQAIADRSDVTITILDERAEIYNITFRIRTPDIGMNRALGFASGIITSGHLLTGDSDELIQIFVPDPPDPATAIVRKAQ